MSPRRSRSAMRTSVMKTSLNSASPVACTSGLTSTPGACMSMTNIVMPLCFTCSGSVRTSTMPKLATCASVVHTFWPLTTHSSPSRIARVDKPGDVGARAGLAEHLAPDLFAGEQRAQVALLLLVGAVRHDRRRAHAVTDRVAAVRDRRAGGEQLGVDGVLQLRRQAETAEALGEVHPRETEVVLRAEELGGRRRLRIELREKVVAQLGHTLLVRRHGGSSHKLDRSVKCTDRPLPSPRAHPDDSGPRGDDRRARRGGRGPVARRRRRRVRPRLGRRRATPVWPRSVCGPGTRQAIHTARRATASPERRERTRRRAPDPHRGRRRERRSAS